MEIVHFIPPSQRKLALLAAQADAAPVIIHGASGTGKSGIARWIHSNSPRSARPMLTATRDLPLRDQIAQAQGSTLLILEIGEWPLGEQKVLLTFLKTKSVPHPDSQSMRMLLNVRIIATTDQNLEGRAQGGLFNPELLEKLNVFRLEMPPLKERMDEFEDIAMGMLREITHELHREYLSGMTEEAMSLLRSHEWSGNLRELRNILRMAVISAKGEELEAKDIPEFDQDKINFRAKREEFEKIYIQELLKTFDWEIDRTCQVSKIDKSTLLRKIKQYDIQLPH